MSDASPPIVVVNPNSDEAVTQAMSAALEGFRLGGGPAIECVTFDDGPIGIMTELHVQEAALRFGQYAQTRPDAGALISACYSQPGVDLARSLTRVPVIGIQDAGVLSALARADLFGVIAVAPGSIPRHLRHLRRLGADRRLAGEVALSEPVSVAESGRGERSFGLLMEAGSRLAAMGAGAVVLGCAGMSGHRARLEAELGIVVIDPTQAAVALALAAILPGQA
ncbi:Asp/Glu racemase [Aurantimonas aggregata]|uniref:Asp/Glu racemase n=1 Tax=Aurantimonas aggregata TaxID=2047720 RepID=A0A6L9MJ59_9HYPH|nr:aspartate/glutamate racemase family protein [Aurantimonas aggregata]NDV87652.1 Asp/Glu racemase [Aurantimonas aggregata]